MVQAALFKATVITLPGGKHFCSCSHGFTKDYWISLLMEAQPARQGRDQYGLGCHLQWRRGRRNNLFLLANSPLQISGPPLLSQGKWAWKYCSCPIMWNSSFWWWDPFKRSRPRQASLEDWYSEVQKHLTSSPVRSILELRKDYWVQIY